MEKQIILLYSCDDWKSHSSMSLVMASTDEKNIRNELKKQIGKQDMEYEADKNDLKNESLSYINNCLKYGLITFVKDGERL